MSTKWDEIEGPKAAGGSIPTSLRRHLTVIDPLPRAATAGKTPEMDVSGSYKLTLKRVYF